MKHSLFFAAALLALVGIAAAAPSFASSRTAIDVPSASVATSNDNPALALDSFAALASVENDQAVNVARAARSQFVAGTDVRSAQITTFTHTNGAIAARPGGGANWRSL